MMLWAICGLVFVSVSLTCVGICLGARGLIRLRRSALPQAHGGGRLRHSLHATLASQAGERRSRRTRRLVVALVGLAGVAVGWLLHFPLILALVIGFLLGALLYGHLWRRDQARQRAFLEQLPNALELMANALRAGLGVNSALEVVAEEIADPLGHEFSKLVADISLGAGLEEALGYLIKRNPSSDLRLFAQAMVIHKQVGGNLAEVLDNLDRTVRERFTIQREVRALTAEQRLTGWILGLLPLLIGAVLAIVNPEYIMTLFTTPPGRYLVGVAAALQVFGVLTLWRILRIEF